MSHAINRYDNDDYSDAYSPRSRESAGKTPLAETQEHKFLLCFDLKTGFMIIGFLEVVATFLQIYNISYSIRIGIACLFLFNAPLLLTWVASQYYA